jgi:hypothetical protein
VRVLDGPPVGSPARAKQLAHHTKNLTSGNAHRRNAAIQRLTKMNLTPVEHMYVQSKVHEHRQRIGGYAGIAQQHGAKTSGGGGFGTIENVGKGLLGIAEEALPSKANIEHPLRFNAKSAKQQWGTLLTHPVREVQQTRRGKYGPDAQKALEAVNQTTGFSQIKHIGSNPLGGGLALAGILPFGKVAELGRAGELGAKAGAAADRASELSGVRGAIAGKRAARLAKKVARRGANRTPEQATGHVLMEAKKARQQGFGRILPKVTTHAPGETAAATGGEAGRLVRQGLHPDFKGMGAFEKVGAKLDNPGISSLRKQQEEARAVERSSRAGAIERASAGKSGLARHIAAKRELEGNLPAGIFKGFQGITSGLRDSAINHIYDHPHFQPYEKVRTADALDEAIAGKVPTKSDQKLLERAFGKEQTKGIIADLKAGGKESAIANVMNIPRSIMASGDLSAPFRQGLVVMASHPGIFFKGFGPMLHAAHSEEFFQQSVKAIHDMPEFPLMEKANLSLTDIGETAKGAENINKREEQFASNLAEQIPGIGHMVRGSDRAYVLFLNATRAKLFTHLVHQAAESGYHLSGPQGEKLLKDIGKFVNSATGRGDLGKLGEHTATLNALFFSPRLMASRFNFLNPAYYMRMEPFARREALKAALRLAGTLNLVLFAAKMAGATVVGDPRNADFGKIRIGNTRVDFAGGFTQPIRLIDQLYTGQVISSTSGKLENLSSSGFGRSRFDVVAQFFENKAAPVPATIIDALKGGSFGQKFSLKNELTQHMIPLLWQDLAQIYHSTGPKGLLGYGLPDVFGVGTQNYSAKSKKPTSQSGGYGNSGGYGSSGGYGGSSGYDSGSGYGG